MTKDKTKRAYARTQAAPKVAQTAAREAWHAVQAAYEATEEAFEEWCQANGVYGGPAEPPPRPWSLQEAHFAARDKLLSTPAPDGDALAYKIAVTIHGFTTLDGDLRKEEERQWIYQHGEDGDRAAMALYLDAVALSGAQSAAAPLPPSGPDLARLLAESDQIGAIAAGIDSTTPEGRAEMARLDAADDELHRQFLRATITNPADALAKLKWLNRAFTSGETGHEPKIVAQLIAYLGGDPVAILCGDAYGEPIAQEELWFDGSPPVSGSQPACPVPELDPAAAAYVAAKRLTADYGHGLDPSGGMGDDPAEHSERAGEEMLRAPPCNLSGVATRLGFIVASAFGPNTGDLDCPHCEYKRKPVASPSVDELEQPDGLRRALVNLYLQASALIGGSRNDR